MSLLLEALKKAERAKEEAQRRVREEGGEAEAAPAPEKKPVVTRDKLPDIDAAPLDMTGEDLAPPARKPKPKEPPRELTIEPLAPAPEARPGKAKAADRADEQAPARQRAKKVFEAKFREPNPKLPFYITLGMLGIFAVGTVVYFWYQLRPPPSLVTLNPPRQAEQAPPPTAELRPVPAVPAASAQNPLAGLPTAAPVAPPPATTPAPPAPKPAAEKPVETPRLQPRIPVTPPAALPKAPGPVIARTAPQVHPSVDAGYAAYLAGDLPTARTQYQEALRDEPANRDALLGMAALEVRAGRHDAAEALYLRVLQGDPRDAQAHAALFALRAGRADPLVTESRVKSMLAAEPSAHALNFTLGNQLASQNRWAEAQQEYFKAYTAEPDNADFAFNLAVSLDHLRQGRQALEYYQRALALAGKRGASFDLNAARQRAAELSK